MFKVGGWGVRRNEGGLEEVVGILIQELEPELLCGCFRDAVDEIITEGCLGGDPVIHELLFIGGISGSREDAGKAYEERGLSGVFVVCRANFSVEHAVVSIGDLGCVFEVVHVSEAVLWFDTEEEEFDTIAVAELIEGGVPATGFCSGCGELPRICSAGGNGHQGIEGSGDIGKFSEIFAEGSHSSGSE